MLKYIRMRENGFIQYYLQVRSNLQKELKQVDFNFALESREDDIS
jgi:hypothetical protein